MFTESTWRLFGGDATTGSWHSPRCTLISTIRLYHAIRPDNIALQCNFPVCNKFDLAFCRCNRLNVRVVESAQRAIHCNPSQTGLTKLFLHVHRSSVWLIVHIRRHTVASALHRRNLLAESLSSGGHVVRQYQNRRVSCERSSLRLWVP